MIAKKDVGLPDIGSERFEVSTPVDDADDNTDDEAADAAG